tara:strand:- start:179 stop:403 length:225 start_codon:yes stop_codon:yes gene_type:complete
MADMAGELMQAKMDEARKGNNNTHILHVGSFHMEIVPDKDIDIAKVFKAVMDDLYQKYGDRLIQSVEGEQRHYG